MLRIRRLLCGALAAIFACAAGLCNAAAAAEATIQVGLLLLRPCATLGAWCGTFSRPLDPHGTVPGLVPIYFEYYAHRDAGTSLGMLVATEGGPGSPATESRADYLSLFEPLRPAHDVLIMDNRGTGHSGAVNCRELQQAPTLTEASVAACGQTLGARAPLYSTALATDDLAALLDALAAGPVDLYGDSYGTFFAQVFAVRHPDKLRTLVLDGAYPLSGTEYAWYPAYAPAMRDKFNLACERSPMCGALPGNSMSHIEPALRLLRARPFPARARDLAGKWHEFTADATQLAIVMFGSAPARATLREVDAAARAFVAGDQRPLLRLMAETLTGVDSRDATQAPENFSAGLAAAVMCQDAPQIFDMSRPPGQRVVERDRLIAERRATAPDTYAPFTIDEYRRMPLDYSFIDECAQWPVAPLDHPAGQVVPSKAAYPKVPTLVVSGDLDNMTPVADGAAAAANFPDGHQLLIRNGLHVNALPRSRAACAADIVRRFIESRAVGDVACGQTAPEIRLVPRFAGRVRELEAARALAGNVAGVAQLRAVTAALLTAGDALVRAPDVTPGAGAGLRGGTYDVQASANMFRVTLHKLRWTKDLAVSGVVDAPACSGAAHARLQLMGDPEVSGMIEADWREGEPLAKATVHGTLGGRIVAAEQAAP